MMRMSVVAAALLFVVLGGVIAMAQESRGSIACLGAGFFWRNLARAS